MCVLLHSACGALSVSPWAGMTEDDLVDMGIASRPLRKSVLIALADLVKHKGMVMLCIAL